MRRRIKKYKDWKLGTKLMFTFLFTSLVPILCVQIFSMYLNKNLLEEKVNALMVSQLAQIAERVDLNLDLYMTIFYQMDGDSYLSNNIKSFLSTDENERALARHALYKQLQAYNESVEGIRCISIICEDGSHVTYDWQSASMVENIWSDYIDIREITPYINAQESTGAVITPTTNYEKSGARMFHISKVLYDLEDVDQSPLATVVMSVDENVLNQLCSQAQQWNESSDDMLDFSINYIVDTDGNIISYPDSFFAGSVLENMENMEKFVQMTGQLQDRKIAINTYQDEKYGWIFCNAYDYDYIFRDITHNMQLAMGLFALVIICALSLMLRTITDIRTSAVNITEGIRKVQNGDFDVQVEVLGEDEFGQIADNFNVMTNRIDKLVNQVEAMAEKKKNAEIHALEAQINPHFLYNTLDSINWLAISRKEYEISTMVSNLAAILRYSVGKSNYMTSVREAADWMEKYISLQQMRFHNSFTYEVHVDERTWDVKMYKLLLQPFLENAMIHGFEDMKNGGVLTVDIMMSDDEESMYIIIEDNGKGMAPSQVEKYNSRKYILEEEEEGIGLQNVFSRMDMYYGERASWNINSVEGMGTVITLVIPTETEGR